MATDAMATARSLALKLGAGQKICLLEYGQGLFLPSRPFFLGITLLKWRRLLFVDRILMRVSGLAGHAPGKALRTLPRWGQIATMAIFRLGRGINTILGNLLGILPRRPAPYFSCIQCWQAFAAVNGFTLAGRIRCGEAGINRFMVSF